MSKKDKKEIPDLIISVIVMALCILAPQSLLIWVSIESQNPTLFNMLIIQSLLGYTSILFVLLFNHYREKNNE